MSDAEALLKAILANPNDDTVRLVYADVIEETQPARAEFIRIQCQLAAWDCAFKQTKEQPGWKHNCDTDNGYWRCQPLRFRERELFEANATQWRIDEIGVIGNTLFATFIDDAPHDAPTGHFIYRRGFPAEFSASWSEWLAHHAAILAAHPVRKVKLTTYPDREWHHREELELIHMGVPPQAYDRVNADGLLTSLPGVLAHRWPGIEFSLPERGYWVGFAEAGAIPAYVPPLDTE